MRIIWTRYALSDAKKAFEYALNEFGQTQVKRLTERISYAEYRISKYPTACTLEQSLLNDERKFRYVPLFKNLELIFHQENDVILIDAIWDSRQNPTRLQQRMK